MSKGGLTIHRADIGNESTVSNTTSEMRWWRTNSFGGGEKDGEWNGSLFLGRKGLEGRVVCGVVCGREERERRGEERRKKRRKKRKRSTSSLFLYSKPLQLPCGAYTLRGYTLHTLPLHTLPNQHRPKNGGSPPPPHQGKGRKKRGKRALFKLINLNFSLWGRTPRPPSLYWDAQEKDKKSGGAR